MDTLCTGCGVILVRLSLHFGNYVWENLLQSIPDGPNYPYPNQRGDYLWRVSPHGKYEVQCTDSKKREYHSVLEGLCGFLLIGFGGKSQLSQVCSSHFGHWSPWFIRKTGGDMDLISTCIDGNNLCILGNAIFLVLGVVLASIAIISIFALLMGSWKWYVVRRNKPETRRLILVQDGLNLILRNEEWSSPYVEIIDVRVSYTDAKYNVNCYILQKEERISSRRLGLPYFSILLPLIKLNKDGFSIRNFEGGAETLDQHGVNKLGGEYIFHITITYKLNKRDRRLDQHELKIKSSVDGTFVITTKRTI
jgi:hypothetical protein